MTAVPIHSSSLRDFSPKCPCQAMNTLQKDEHMMLIFVTSPTLFILTTTVSFWYSDDKLSATHVSCAYCSHIGCSTIIITPDKFAQTSASTGVWVNKNNWHWVIKVLLCQVGVCQLDPLPVCILTMLNHMGKRIFRRRNKYLCNRFHSRPG